MLFDHGISRAQKISEKNTPEFRGIVFPRKKPVKNFNTDILEKVQKREMILMVEDRNLSGQDRLRTLVFSALETWRLCDDLTEVFYESTF